MLCDDLVESENWFGLAHRRGSTAVPAVRIRRVEDPSGLCRLAEARRLAFLAEGIAIDDSPFEQVRRQATNLAFEFEGEISGGLSFWRLSDAPCTLGHLLTDIDFERCDPARIAEVGLLFVAPRLHGLGLSRQLFGAAIPLLAQLSMEWIVTFAVQREAARYVRLFGFSEVGASTAHPLSPSIHVVPLAAKLSQVRSAWRQQCGVDSLAGARDASSGGRVVRHRATHTRLAAVGE